jgi:hypothetical protein
MARTRGRAAGDPEIASALIFSACTAAKSQQTVAQSLVDVGVRQTTPSLGGLFSGV